MSRKKILQTGLMLRPGDDPAVLENTDIFIDDNMIVAVGTEGSPFQVQEADEVVKLDDQVVLPGFINTHTHSALTFLRGVAQDVGLDGFFRQLGPYNHLISKDNAYWATMLALAESIRSGITTCVDMFQWMDESGKAFEESGIRGVLVCELAGVRPEPRRARGTGFSLNFGRLILDDAYGRERLAQAEDEIEACRAMNCDRLIPFLGPHATYSCSPELLSEISNAAKRLRVSISIHLAEHRGLEAQVRRRYGSTYHLLLQTGILDLHCLGIHCIYLGSDEIDYLSNHAFGVAHCPGSNLKLGEKPAPIQHFLDVGTPVGLGTDSTMSNDNLDILEEARLAALIHKSHHRSAEVLKNDIALQMATCLAAQAIGLGNKIGRLRPGYLADLIVLDTVKPHWTPSPYPMMSVLYAASSQDIRSTMVNGIWVMRDKEIMTFNEKIVIEHANRVVRRKEN